MMVKSKKAHVQFSNKKTTTMLAMEGVGKHRMFY
jgi:hypothetical protein